MASRNSPNSRRPEMVQLDRHDYVFDENGGRGTPASTFFKRLASSSHSRNSSSAQIGDNIDSKVVGAAYSHADALRMEQLSLTSSRESPEPRTKQSLSSKSSTYFDLDDDWDANIEHDTALSKRIEKSIENKPDSSKSSKELYSTSRNVSGLKMQFDGIIRDPASSLYSLHDRSSGMLLARVDSNDSTTTAEIEEINSRILRINRFKKVLQASNVDIGELKKLAWSGIPEELRPMSWQLLLGYLPTNAERRVATLARKRKEYLDGVEQVFSSGLDQVMWHQISIDVPRTNPHIKLYGFEATQRALERILYLWAIRHPASGYVQGINDLVTPFFQSFLSAYIDTDPENYDPGKLPKEVLDVVEADSFWCLTKLLDGIQDNYIHAQPGIQRQVAELRDLTTRIDASLVKHLTEENVEFMQFSFRWMNCLLMREVSVKNTIRMWDTYMAEGPNGFSEFHVYVCAAFLVKWSQQLQKMDFQEIMMFLQALPTKDWTEKDMELLLSEAFMWQSLFKNASAHLRS
ncbi:GTPase-activating protein Gyp1p [Trichomonascus vanleenenianus]|uniref:GTPase-activating protein GYP1 n=1 Tax=Trichomonascus vanleenenianus TaxID=2268995 RepID=UPI003ECAB704